MSITHNKLLAHIKRIIKPALEPIGYRLSSPPETRNTLIWFMKEPTLTDPLYRIVEFQPTGLSREEITRVAINLVRRSYYNFDYPPEGAMQKSDLHVRLTPWLWGDGKPYTEEDWWYIFPLEELDDKLRDMQAKIIKYGIPFIEDINSTNELAITMRKSNG